MKQSNRTVLRAATKTKRLGIILTDTVPTPLGPMVVCSTENGICLLEFRDHQPKNSEKEVLEKKLNGIVKEGENVYIKQVKQELKEYFSGERRQFDVPLQFIGTAFQQSVWKYLLDLPYGTTTTYMKQALALGNPKAVRAVAAANGQNKIAIIIPCHRVVGTNGKLTGYAGGLERKRWLLDFESRMKGAQYSLQFNEWKSGSTA